MKGAPTRARIGRQALDATVAQALWARSQALTGRPFPA